MTRPERVVVACSVSSSSAMTVSSSTGKSTIPERLRKTSLGFIANARGKRTQYYISIMSEAHWKMRLRGESVYHR